MYLLGKKFMRFVLVIAIIANVIFIIKNLFPEKFEQRGEFQYIYQFKSGDYAILYHDGKVDLARGDYPYEKFDQDGVKIDAGRYYDRVFYSYENWGFSVRMINFFLLFWFFSYAFRYGYEDYIQLRDWFNLKYPAKVKEQPTDLQNETISRNIHCSRCQSAPDFSISTEETKEGMKFIYGQCNICLKDKRIRIIQ